MEFKRKVKKKRKLAKIKRKKKAGYQRVKIRGRKRWVKADKSEAGAE